MTTLIENTTLTRLQSRRLRNLLLTTTMVASALSFGYGGPVQAQTYVPTANCTVDTVTPLTVTCIGDQTDGIVVTDDAGNITLEVNNLTADIDPVSGRGIFLTTTNDAGDGLNRLTIVSDTGGFAIHTTDNDADGVAIIVKKPTAPSIISITHTGDITTDGVNASAIRATSFWGNYVEGRSITVISEGDLITKGSNTSRGIHAEGDATAVSITHTGDITTLGTVKENHGILARNFGEDADPAAEGNIMVWQKGDITTYGAARSQGIYVIQDTGRVSKIEIFSYGNITTHGLGENTNYGINANADAGSYVYITKSGDITIHGSSSAIRAYAGAISSQDTKGNITITLRDSNITSKLGKGVEIVQGIDNTLNIYDTVTIAGGTEYPEYYAEYLEEVYADKAEYLASDEYTEYLASLLRDEEPDFPWQLEDPDDPNPPADIQGGSGNETINIYGDLTSPGIIKLDGGNDTIIIHNDGSLTSGGTIDLGNGDDAIHNYGSLSTGGTIDFGLGDNVFYNHEGAVSDGLRLVVDQVEVEVVEVDEDDDSTLPTNNVGGVGGDDAPDDDAGDPSIEYEYIGSLTITNEGTIDGGDADFAIQASGADITVDNSGVIIGDVQLGEGDDTFTLRTGGTLDGDLDMGDVEVVVVDPGIDDPNVGDPIGPDVEAPLGVVVVEKDIDTFVLTGEGSDIFAGNVTGAEFLKKTGEGTWALDGVVDISFATLIEAGRLNVGSTANCAEDACILNTIFVQVQDGATLGGHGRILNTFDEYGVDLYVGSGGTLAPGSSVGTLTVEGDVTVQEDGLLSFELDGGGSADYLDVTGTLTLDENSVVSVMPIGAWAVREGPYDLARAGNLVDNGAITTSTVEDMIDVGDDWSLGNGLGNDTGAEIEIEITEGEDGTITADVSALFGCFQIRGDVLCVNGDADGIPDEGDPESPGPVTHDYNGYKNTDADTALTIVVEADAKVNNDKTDVVEASGFDIAAPMDLTINTGASVSGNLHGILARNDAIINNYGTIEKGTGSAIEADVGEQHVTNHDGATITGAINLGAGNDSLTLETGSTLTGDVDLGSEDGDGDLDALYLTGADTGTWAGDIKGGETLTKTDAGHWRLSGDVVARLSTDIDAGQLSIDGMLTSAVVNINLGGTLGGIGTIVTNPGADGGINVSGHVPDQDDPFDVTGLTDEELADLITKNELPENFILENVEGNFDLVTDTPVRGSIAPGNSIGTLNVVGNVTFDSYQTMTSTYTTSNMVAVDLIAQKDDGTLIIDDPETDDVDESAPDGINDFDMVDDKSVDRLINEVVEGREVVTNWGGRFEAELNNLGDNDLLAVTKSGIEEVEVDDGHVTLGGLLDIVLERGLYDEEGMIYDIITAEGGVDGKFDFIGFDGGANDGAFESNEDFVSYDADGNEIRYQAFKGYLEYQTNLVRIISIPNFVGLANTGNQWEFSNYLDSLTRYGLHEDDLTRGLAYLGLTENLGTKVNWMLPELYNAYTEVAISQATGIMQQGTERALQARHGDRLQLSVSGYGQDTSAGASDASNGFSFWVSAGWNRADVESSKGFVEYDFDGITGYIGIDYVAGDRWLFGLIGSLGDTDVHFDVSDASSGDVDTWSIGGYASYFGDNGAYVNVGVGYGDMDMDTVRDGQFTYDEVDFGGVANSSHNGDFIYIYGQVGFTFETSGDWHFSPEISLSFVDIDQDAITETGDGPFMLEVDAQSNQSLRGLLQVRADKEFGDTLFHANVGIANEFKDGLRIINARFVGDEGNFITNGETPRGVTAIFDIGLSRQITKSVSLQIDYAGEFGSNFQSHGVMGSLNLAF